MKIIIALLLTALTCSAQYRYNVSRAGSTGTNSIIAATTQTTYNSGVDVGASTVADIQYRFRLLSGTETNIVRLWFDRSMDAGAGTNSPIYFGTEYFTNWANGTNWVTNRWQTSVSNAAILRFVAATNGNSVSVTNDTLYIGRKVGL